LPKLIRAGERIAICDQLEAPKQTAKRGITEMLTPSAAVEKEQKTEPEKQQTFHR
jgi:DNA mismatch repair ATPase MutS